MRLPMWLPSTDGRSSPRSGGRFALVKRRLLANRLLSLSLNQIPSDGPPFFRHIESSGAEPCPILTSAITQES